MNDRRYYPFFIISILHVLSILLGWEIIGFWTKCLLIPSLALGVWFHSDQITQRKLSFKSLVSALFFSTLGDIYLLFDDRSEIYFFLGLGSFFFAQISFIITFKKIWNIDLSFKWSIIYLFILILFLSILYPGMPFAMKIPVTVYGSTLIFMAWCSWRLYNYDKMVGTITVMGSTLFVASDSILAINKFKWAIPQSSFLIMLTYIIAQFLMSWSVVQILNKNKTA